MTFSVYVIKSLSTNKFYIGQTTDLQKHLQQHNDPHCLLTLYTKRNRDPWSLIYHKNFFTRPEAIKREKQLKSSQGRSWLKENILNKAPTLNSL